MRRWIWLLVLAPLAGCAAELEGAGNVFVQPGKYRFLRCEDLAARAAGTVARQKELAGLMERAEQGTAGPLVNILVYRSDYEQARADEQEIRRTQREKGCPEPAASPPPAPPPAAKPAARKR